MRPVARRFAHSALATLAVLALIACGAIHPTRATAAATGGVSARLPEAESPVAGVETIASNLQLALQRLGYNPGAIDGDFSTNAPRQP